jgi:GTP cyclohydrolase I
MSFAQIYRAFKGYQQRHEQQETLTREVAYLIYATNTKNPKPKNIWWQIGDVEDKGVTPEETKEIYKQYGKLKRHGRKRNESHNNG